MLHMIQKCSIIKVLGVFFREPREVHFVREISREIGLAPTSVRKHIVELEKEELIMKKKAKPFDGYVANRDDERFLFYKRVWNINSLFELNEKLIGSFHPKAIVVFGSYSRGEDVEESDIDIMIISKVKKEINLGKFERELKRKINIMVVDSIGKLEKRIQSKIRNGIVLHGEI
jgi:predicted nucleotidyltransferase